MAHLIVKEQDKLKKFEITEDFVFIGRTPENNIMISDPAASRQHCQIIKTEAGYRLLDLGSESGTLMRGQKIKQRDLKEGDVFQIGEVKFAIKEIGVAPPTGLAAAAAKSPAAGGRGSAGRKRRQKPEPIKVNKEMAAASARGGHMVRKNLRKGSKIPGWAQALIAFWVIVIVVGAAWYVIGQRSEWGDVYREGLDLWEKDHKLEAAYNKFESIPEDDPVYGEDSRKKMKEIVAEREAGNLQFDAVNASRNYENNIVFFIEKFIAAPDKPKRALKIKRDYAADRASYVRVLLQDRIKPFMERFKKAPQYKDVERLYRKYSKEVNIDSPATFRDSEVRADMFLNLSGYGQAYQAMSQWMAANPNSGFKERAEWTFKTIQNRCMEEWKIQEPQVVTNEASAKWAYAVKKLGRMLKLTEGYDSAWGRKFRVDLERRKAENQAKVNAAAGL